MATLIHFDNKFYLVAFDTFLFDCIEATSSVEVCAHRARFLASVLFKQASCYPIHFDTFWALQRQNILSKQFISAVLQEVYLYIA